MVTEEDPFLKTAAGRMPLPTVLGAAPTVVGEGQPMRPDRSYTTLKWLSTLGGFFGLDHFYLRNPYSGALKALTFGGFFIWWLWDAFQLWTEKERVLLYGLSAPFDIKMGFGQGTIADDKTHYEQRSDSAWWMVAALFSFAGGDSMLLGNWGQMVRKLTELALVAMFVIPLVMTWRNTGIEGLITFGNIFRALIGGMIGFIMLSEWTNVTGSTFGDPAAMFTNGIRVSAKQDKVLNFPRAWIENIDLFGEDIQKQIMKDIGYTTISPEAITAAFKVTYTTPQTKEADVAAEDAAAASEAAAKAASPIRWHWLLSYLIYLFGPLVILAQMIIKGIKMGFYAIFPAAKIAADLQAKAAAAATSKNPLGALSGIELPTLSSIPGLGGAMNVIDKAKQEVASMPSSMLGKIANTVTGQSGNVQSGNVQSGGARSRGEEPTSQGMILGASVFALAGGAAIKLAIDYLLPSQ